MYVYVRMYVGRYVGKYACVQVGLRYSRYKCRYIGKRQVRMYVSKGLGRKACTYTCSGCCYW